VAQRIHRTYDGALTGCLEKGKFMKEESNERAWVRLVVKFETAWLFVRNGSNELVKRIVSSFQRFASGKQL
jgi:hypothetical protein